MRINDTVQQNIDFTKFQFGSWLDIGCGEGLVAQEWRYFSDIPKKVAIDPCSDLTFWKPEDMFSHLDDKWTTYPEAYNESHTLWNEQFDLITIMDTIQYYYRPEGERVLENLIKNTNKLLVIWTTDGYYPDNGHVSCWHEEDFKKLGMKTVVVKGFHAGPPIIGDGLISYYEK